MENLSIALASKKKEIDKLIAERSVISKQIDNSTEELAQLKTKVEAMRLARVLLQEVGNSTQKNLESHLGNIVTLALTAVFPDPPMFKTDFVVRRNQTECDLLLSNDGDHWFDPVEGDAGGAADVISFALRVAFWSMHKNRYTMVLDEPFRNLSPGFHKSASQMLELVSKELDLQLIMVSHAESINVSADKTLLVSKKGVRSSIEEI